MLPDCVQNATHLALHACKHQKHARHVLEVNQWSIKEFVHVYFLKCGTVLNAQLQILLVLTKHFTTLDNALALTLIFSM